jgi:hypothetical protein
VELRRVSVLSAVVIGVAGIGVTTAPASALPPFPLAPACASWTLPSPQLVLNLSNGETASFGTFGNRIGGGVDRLEAKRVPYKGTSNGQLVNSALDITVKWTPESQPFTPMFGDETTIPAVESRFEGRVAPDGTATGNAIDNNNFNVNWTSRDKFTCADAPAAAEAPKPEAPPQAPPKPCPEGSVKPEVPATENCVPPTNTVTMNISGGGFSRTVTVNNSGPLGGSCAYNATATGGIFAPPLSRTIDVGPNAQAAIDVPAPPLGSTYRVTLTCTGTYDGKQVTFGQAEQTVSA